ncbi:hypothetical protein THAOC_29141 [Thalassiosira oceanica]|uniref:BRCT domain-containing protein n=1 Tax=Thalassiosira oceanica TaxID=159749 RepID=K0RYF6_THAOC|nr:hypothetical protein THAOC_29141 [Thalassiosira oceanica]|eukprot:EJK51667.1 hypothetical protein THAOC_29141 [Thalassiosira oceanica]
MLIFIMYLILFHGDDGRDAAQAVFPSGAFKGGQGLTMAILAVGAASNKSQQRSLVDRLHASEGRNCGAHLTQCSHLVVTNQSGSVSLGLGLVRVSRPVDLEHRGRKLGELGGGGGGGGGGGSLKNRKKVIRLIGQPSSNEVTVSHKLSQLPSLITFVGVVMHSWLKPAHKRSTTMNEGRTMALRETPNHRPSLQGSTREKQER